MNRQPIDEDMVYNSTGSYHTALGPTLGPTASTCVVSRRRGWEIIGNRPTNIAARNGCCKGCGRMRWEIYRAHGRV